MMISYVLGLMSHCDDFLKNLMMIYKTKQNFELEES